MIPQIADVGVCRSTGKSGDCWGPSAPPHVGAMLRGRLVLRALGGKEGEMLAAMVRLPWAFEVFAEPYLPIQAAPSAVSAVQTT